MKKKLLSLFMACAMALSLALPALADDNYNEWEEDNESDELTQTIDIEARTYVPTVKLTLPTFAADNLVLNPYKLTFSVSDDDVLNGKDVVNPLDATRQVISPVYSIQNDTDVALKYTVSATTTLGSSAAFTFDTKHVSLTEKTKKAYIALVLKKTESETAQIANGEDAEQILDPYDTANNETIVLGVGTKSSGNSVKKLASAASDTNYLWFQFYGSLSRTPETGWTEDDNFTTQLVFTFTPESGQDYTVNATLETSAAAGSDLSADEELSMTGAIAGSATDGSFDSLKDAAGSAIATSAVAKISDLAGATPGWQMVSAGAYSATISTAGVIKYPKAMGKTLTGSSDGEDNTDNLVIGFNDKNGVPRTIGVTVTITHTHTTGS